MLMPSSPRYYVVAYDQRGYGRTTGWDNRSYHELDLNTFRTSQFIKDAVILVQTLGYKEVACVIGNDVGAAFAPLCAMIRPDIFRSCVTHPLPNSQASR
jgi:pimeloyl-ACP methyl ester carboxylesterase